MSSFAHCVVVYVTVVVVAVVSQNPPPPRAVQPFRGGGGGGGSFRCPNQEKGSYEYPGDCTQFYLCDEGESTLIVCPPQLVFNPRAGYCDYSSEAQNPNCPAQESNLPPEVRNLCRDNPGIKEQAFHVGHPEICNAFYTCTSNYLHNYCTFCGVFEYFSVESRGCRNFQTLGQDLNTICQGRRYVEHKDKVTEQLRSCWPYNPLLALLVSGQHTPGPQRPG